MERRVVANTRRRRTTLSAWQSIRLGVRFVAVSLFLYTLIAVMVAYAAIGGMEATDPWRRSAVVACMVAMAFFLALLDRNREARLIRMRNAKRIRAAGRHAIRSTHCESAAPESKT